MEYKENDGEKREVNEPVAGAFSLKGKEVRFFHSFEEQAAAEAEDAANRTPIERIRDTVQLILRAYGVTQEELNMRTRSNKIKITKYEA